MLFVPLTAANNIEFGVSQHVVEKRLGQPLRRLTDRLGRVEIHYSSAIYRFEGSSLEEISLDAPVVELGAVAVKFEDLAAFLQKNDPSCFERVGFLVSPRYGLAHDPAFASWVTAFPSSQAEVWRSVGP